MSCPALICIVDLMNVENTKQPPHVGLKEHQGGGSDKTMSQRIEIYPATLCHLHRTGAVFTNPQESGYLNKT